MVKHVSQHQGNHSLWFEIDGSGMRQRIRADQKKLEKLFKDSRSIDDVNERILKRQARRWVKNYVSQGAEYGSLWAPPAGRSGPALRNTGKQFGIFKEVVNDDAYFNNLGVSWQFNNDVAAGFYAVSHHTGYGGPGSGFWSIVPPRKIWDLDAKDDNASYRIFSRWAHNEIRKVFGG